MIKVENWFSLASSGSTCIHHQLILDATFHIYVTSWIIIIVINNNKNNFYYFCNAHGYFVRINMKSNNFTEWYFPILSVWTENSHIKYGFIYLNLSLWFWFVLWISAFIFILSLSSSSPEKSIKLFKSKLKLYIHFL